MKIVTGIGSRETPEEILAQMVEIGFFCRERQIAVRSGHADGADWAFERGAQEFCVAYLPWPGFNGNLKSNAKQVLYAETEASRDLVAKIHPAPHRLTRGTWALHGRNTWQILGSRLERPSDLVVCWTPSGKIVGGTATAIRLAELRGIPVMNLGDPEVSLQSILRCIEDLSSR